MSKVKDDPRIDPRIKAIFGDMPMLEQTDVESREALLAEANTEEAIAEREQAMAMFAMMDNDEVAPSAGLEILCPDVSRETAGSIAQFCREA